MASNSTTSDLQIIAGIAVKIAGSETRYTASKSQPELLGLIAAKLVALSGNNRPYSTLSEPDLIAIWRDGMIGQSGSTGYTAYISTNDTELLQVIAGSLGVTTASVVSGNATLSASIIAGTMSNPVTGAVDQIFTDSATLVWKNAILAAGGSVTTGQQTAVDTFVKSAKTNGYWNNLLDVGPLAGSDLTSAKVKLKNYSGTGTSVTATNFVSGDYSVTAGLQGASTKFLDTGFNYQTFGSASLLGMSTYINDEFITTSGSGEYVMGRDNGQAAPYLAFYSLNIGGQTVFGGGSTFNINNGGGQMGRGLYHYARSSLSAAAAYLNGHKYASSASTITDSATKNVTHAIFKGGGGSSAYLVRRVSFYAIDDGLMGDTKAALFGADVQQLQRDLGRIVPAAYPIRFVPHMGQSLASGTQGSPALSTTQPYQNRMLLSYTAGIPSGTAATSYPWTFAPLREISQETLASGCSNLVSQLWRADHASDASRDVVIGNYATGSSAYSVLKKGGTGLNYAEMITEITGVKTTALDYGTSLAVPYIAVVHGENDAASSTYQTDIETWQSDAESDIKAITGQSGTIPMLHSQPSAWTSTGNLNAATGLSHLAILAAYEANPTKSVLVCPKYIFTYAADGLHLVNTSYRWLGEYYAKAANAINRGQTWTPLRPSNIARSGAVITVTMAGGVGNLVLDTTAVSDPGNSGFEWTQTGGTSRTIASVAVSGSDTVTITLSGDPGAATNMRVRYAYTGTAGNAGGPTTGPRGCLRDSDTSVTSRNSYTLYNWCVHFDKVTL